MKKNLIAVVISLLCASGHAVPDQGTPAVNPKAESRCELSNGVKMLLGYSALKGRRNPEGAEMDLFTSNVVSVRGTIIPFGLYKVSTVHNSNTWTLVMRQVADNGITPLKSNSPLLVELPMSIKKISSPLTTLAISLNPVGQTCTLRMEWQTSQASVEFAAKGQDLSTR